ncbi:zeta toxin family protein [Streptomyces katrae]|uniref:UDP-N-acetylglucosamine kinase n=1 Tax=Streptomyces katrae TaxID=68223 RepID=A0ABT7GRB3_9ACTN|nr:zeta toxin family protein [Streptomyces katrae]MDK9496145.1 zeta toxin family protein [Streptomyces katrae]
MTITAHTQPDEAEHQRALVKGCLPGQPTGAVSRKQPVLVLVAGQPGSGTTMAADLLQASLCRRGQAVRFGDDTTGRREHEASVRAARLDVVMETALAGPAEARALSGAYRSAGYRIELVALAVPEAVSQLGVLSRFLGEAEDRYVTWSNHDARELRQRTGSLRQPLP